MLLVQGYSRIEVCPGIFSILVKLYAFVKQAEMDLHRRHPRQHFRSDCVQLWQDLSVSKLRLLFLMISATLVSSGSYQIYHKFLAQ